MARSPDDPQGIRVASVFELSVCSLFSANFLIFLLLILLFYSILLCYWPAPPTIHRGLEWPQCLNCLSVCLSVCLIVCLFSVTKFSNSSPHPPFLLARSPDDPQRIRVASVFEFSVCLFVLCGQIFSISFIGPLISFHFIHFKF